MPFALESGTELPERAYCHKHPGYARCAFESLGLVSLILHHPEMTRALDREPLHVSNPGDPEEALTINELIGANRDKTEIAVFDAAQVPNDSIAGYALKHKNHPGFHTRFVLSIDPMQEGCSTQPSSKK